MTTSERKAELTKREEKRIINLPHIFISLDDEIKYETNIMDDAVGFVRDYITKKPFWESNALIIRAYKRLNNNEAYKNRFKPNPNPSNEKNVMFKDDKRKYVCIRCRRENEVCGFCSKCYVEVYGLQDRKGFEVKLSDIRCNKRFMNIVKNDPEYTEKIKQSILADGMKNPIILDLDHNILIGHHRYYIALELGWKYIDAIYNPIKFGHDYFYEGKGYDLFVTKIDGRLEGSSTEEEDIYRLMRDFEAQSIGDTLVVECFLNIGSDIRLRDVFIPERGHIVDQTWKDWWINKFGKEPR